MVAKEEGDDISISCRFRKATAAVFIGLAVLGVLAISVGAISAYRSNTIALQDAKMMISRQDKPIGYSCDSNEDCDDGVLCCHRSRSRGYACGAPGICPF